MAFELFISPQMVRRNTIKRRKALLEDLKLLAADRTRDGLYKLTDRRK